MEKREEEILKLKKYEQVSGFPKLKFRYIRPLASNIIGVKWFADHFSLSPETQVFFPLFVPQKEKFRWVWEHPEWAKVVFIGKMENFPGYLMDVEIDFLERAREGIFVWFISGSVIRSTKGYSSPASVLAPLATPIDSERRFIPPNFFIDEEVVEREIKKAKAALNNLN